jgi:hypothetical protein
MSGAYGWAKSSDGASRSSSNRTGYNDAYQGYHPGKARVVKIDPAADPPPCDARQGPQRDRRSFAAGQPAAAPGASHALTASARNVVIVLPDGTRSMGVWTDEIFKRLPLLWDELVQIFGAQDNELLFGTFGDAKCDPHPLQISRFGRAQELDALVASLKPDRGGGGDGAESPELAAYYLASKIDFARAVNVFAFLITDEAGADQVNAAHARRHLEVEPAEELLDTCVLMRHLRRRMRLNTLLMDSHQYDFTEIERWWESMLPEGVLRLDVPERAVDVICLAIAESLSAAAGDAFLTRFGTRQAGKAHEDDNRRIISQTRLTLQGRLSRIKLPGPSSGQTRSPLG